VGGGDLVGPGLGWVDLEELASSGGYETAGDGEDAQPQAFRFVAGGGAGQREALGPDEQVGGRAWVATRTRRRCTECCTSRARSTLLH
jgi:hypothetical protein